MSDGGIIQLATVGAQDCNFLSDNLNDTLFKETEKKINNCCKATFSMYPNGKATWGTTTRFKIQKKGDMLGSLYFVAKLPQRGHNGSIFDKWVDYIGNVLIENVKLFIGGQLIDEQTGDFAQIYTDLYDDDWNKLCLIGLDDTLTTPSDSVDSTFVYVPLQFWFCQKLQNSLPIIALQYHDIEIEVKIRKFEDCHKIFTVRKTTEDTDRDVVVLSKSKFKYNGIPKINEVKLDCNFIFLNSEERKKLAQSEHKILINQTQKITQPVKFEKIVELNFNHPVKEMFWFFRNTNVTFEDGPFNFSTSSESPDLEVFNRYDTVGNKMLIEKYYTKEHWLGKARLLINGHERIEWKDFMYYHYLQNYENFRNKLEHYVYLYSFSLNPKAETPLGSLNFSRIDNAQLEFNINEESRRYFNKQRDSEGSSNFGSKGKDENLEINIYATNYNYLLIKSGMAGLAYTS